MFVFFVRLEDLSAGRTFDFVVFPPSAIKEEIDILEAFSPDPFPKFVREVLKEGKVFFVFLQSSLLFGLQLFL